MSQLATIFEKIKDDFYSNHVKEDDREKYKLIFSPFSTGFTYDDFLFLDTNNASDDGDAVKYYDELYEFSQIANTIPREDNFWAVSDHNDYLFKPYKNILDNLRFMDTDSITIDILYEHPIFLQALNLIDKKISVPYRTFFDLRTKLVNEIKQLRESLTEANRLAVDLEIGMKQNNIQDAVKEWSEKGHKEEVEAKIMEIVKDEYDRFIKGKTDIDGRLNSSRRTHSLEVDYYVTSCMPNNLYKGDQLEWKKIELKKDELQALLQKIDKEKYEEIMGTSELSKLEIEGIDFELMFVNVTRAWYDESILESPFWSINILDPKEIEIPRTTNKLIFVRNVEVKLPQNSDTNKTILQKNVIQNLGPFIINASQLQQNKCLKLKSVNKSLQVDRMAVLDVGSKLKSKQKTNSQNLVNLIGTKQMKFIKFAPQLKKKHTVVLNKQALTSAANISLAPTTKVRPKGVLIATATVPKTQPPNQNVKCKFIFTDKKNNGAISITQGQIAVKTGNGKSHIATDFKQEGHNTFVVNLRKGNTYKLIININGYETLEYPYMIPNNHQGNIFQKGVALTKKVEELQEVAESFQLIGVISKEITPFPNPIEGADYI